MGLNEIGSTCHSQTRQGKAGVVWSSSTASSLFTVHAKHVWLTHKPLLQICFGLFLRPYYKYCMTRASLCCCAQFDTRYIIRCTGCSLLSSKLTHPLLTDANALHLAITYINHCKLCIGYIWNYVQCSRGCDFSNQIYFLLRVLLLSFRAF